jgi:hypothetical protein
MFLQNMNRVARFCAATDEVPGAGISELTQQVGRYRLDLYIQLYQVR